MHIVDGVWPAIVAVAKALTERKSLDANEFAAIYYDALSRPTDYTRLDAQIRAMFGIEVVE